MADFPDANLWIALTSSEHANHRRAVEYWQDEAVGPISFCRTTALGLVRVLSGKHAVGGDPLTFEESWRRYLDWRADPGVVLTEEPPDVENALGKLVARGLVRSKNSTDAYLAAFAMAAGLRLVTFDKGFEDFPGLDLLRLES